MNQTMIQEPRPRTETRSVHPTAAQLQALTTEELFVLYHRAVNDQVVDDGWVEKLRNVLIEVHLPLVRHIARRLQKMLPKMIEFDDLVSAGTFGLLDAIRGFDLARGTKFKTFCHRRIRGSMLDQMRSQDWVPRSVRLKATRIEKVLHRLYGEYGREPTHTELAEALELSPSELVNEIAAANPKTVFSLFDQVGEHEALKKLDMIENPKASDPMRDLEQRELMAYLTESLSEKERFIINLYYECGYTMREIGEVLSLTESRVCQIHSNVMSRLRHVLESRGEGLLS